MHRAGHPLRAIGRTLGDRRPRSSGRSTPGQSTASTGRTGPSGPGPRAGHGPRPRTSPQTVRCVDTLRTSCATAGPRSRSVTLWSSSSPTTRACG
ncbi:hypothetical protein [Streptomyces sp. WAC07094]|uniref:hypothetical protein n=1 Tax=Streptomyces sp. WAC07094 TaxID=3072183 RepID=UPI0032AFA241